MESPFFLRPDSLEPYDVRVRLLERLYLGKNGILQLRSVADKSVRRSNSLHGGVQPRKALIGDRRRYFGAIAPRYGILVCDDDTRGLFHRLEHGFAIPRTQRA